MTGYNRHQMKHERNYTSNDINDAITGVSRQEKKNKFKIFSIVKQSHLCFLQRWNSFDVSSSVDLRLMIQFSILQLQLPLQN